MTTEVLTDTRCHIDVYDNPLAVLDDARAAGVHVMEVTEDPGKYSLPRTRLGLRDGVDVALGFTRFAHEKYPLTIQPDLFGSCRRPRGSARSDEERNFMAIPPFSSERNRRRPKPTADTT